MFGRFRKTNDPARETDGGAVAVSRARARRAGDQRRHAARRAGDAASTTPRDEPRRPASLRRPPTRPRASAASRAARAPDRRRRHARAERDRVVETDARRARPLRARRARARGRREPVADRDVDDEPRTIPAVVAEDTVVAMRARQRDRFGGIRWGSAFFGLLSAIGLAAILLGIAAAAGVAFGLSEINDVRTGTPTRSDSAAPSCCWPSSRSPGTAAATSPGAWRASTACDRASACGCGPS